MYTMTLSSTVNMDFPPERRVPAGPTETVTFENLIAAGYHVIAYCNRHDLGGGSLKRVEVTDDTGAVVARVSYNGRIWLPGPPPERPTLDDWAGWVPMDP